MEIVESSVARVVSALRRSVSAWIEADDEAGVRRWLERELDSQGVPGRLPVSDWPRCLAMLAEGRRSKECWPFGSEERVAAFVISALRFTRPDLTGTMDFASDSTPKLVRRKALAEWAGWFPDSPIACVLGWWIPRIGADDALSPPLPAWASERGVLAMLRADWRTDGDLLAVEHRAASADCRFELRGAGQSWLGPKWNVAGLDGPRTRPKLGWWLTLSTADRVEWSERVAGVSVTRSAMLLRGRKMALLSTTIQPGRSAAAVASRNALSSIETKFAMAPGVEVRAMAECRGLNLSAAGTKVSAQAFAVGLPCAPYATERGALSATDEFVSLRQAMTGRRTFLPLLVSWDKARNRKKVSWRVLTVTESAQVVTPDRAFAVRVSWGRDETYVIYRSLEPPALRTFLGYQTHARFMLGRFNAEGFVEPIVVDV
jgi:hypothetical protein